MSIINEALKKAQDQKEQLKKDDSLPIMMAVETKRPAPAGRRSGMLWLGIVVVLLVLTAVVISFEYLKIKNAIEEKRIITAEEATGLPVVSVAVPTRTPLKGVRAGGGRRPLTKTVTREGPHLVRKPAVQKQKVDIAVDVFSPNEPEQVSAPHGLNLTGIVFSSGQDYAVINNKILELGDSIGAGKVVSIEKNKVKILLDGEEITLDLK